MEVKKYRLDSEITTYGQVNNGFAKVKILVNTHEQVANGTKFSKELLDSKMSKLNYLPIVGEFKDEPEDFGTHGGKLEISDDDFKFIDTTRPYGVVIENSGRWEMVKQKNGESIEYVVCDGYVWLDRYPELNTLFEGKENNQSMEISVNAGHWGDDNVFYIDDFEYSALCILGKKVMPAFEEAKIEVNFESQDFKVKYEEMLQALDRYLANAENTDEKEVFEMEDKKKEFEETTEEVKEEEIIVNVEETKEESVEMTETQEQQDEKDFDLIISEYEQEITNLKSQLVDVSSKYTVIETELNELRQFKSNKLTEERYQQEEQLFSQYVDLDGVAEYEKIKDNASKFEKIEDIEKEIALVYVKNKAKFSKQEKTNTTIKLPLDTKKNEEYSPYGDLFDKYSK